MALTEFGCWPDGRGKKEVGKMENRSQMHRRGYRQGLLGWLQYPRKTQSQLSDFSPIIHCSAKFKIQRSKVQPVKDLKSSGPLSSMQLLI